ncbi:MAG TPA: response regulator [Syntrophorhabdales bacterium]|nr:response regulator [Syntrophorhabdales bacterium]
MTSRRPRHILLVEDDEDTLGATTAMLQRLGYSVRAETEGLKALRTFSEEPGLFDLALLDHGVADLTGLELARRMRRIRPGFPVVVYTGYLDTPSSEQMEAAGIGGRVVIKPATLKELADALQDALEGRAKSRGEP